MGYAQPSSDVYSLAKVVIEMVTGKRLAEVLPTASIDLTDRVQELLLGLRQVHFSAESIHIFATALELILRASRPPQGCPRAHWCKTWNRTRLQTMLSGKDDRS